MYSYIAGTNFNRPGPWLWIGGVAVLIFIVCTPAYASVVNFNRPKLLVPLPFRDELGARVSRKLRKRQSTARRLRQLRAVDPETEVAGQEGARRVF
jgi:hypothetical protein